MNQNKRAIWEALLVSAIVTVLVTVASRLPERFVALVVGAVFLLATWAMVWRHDDVVVERFGLAFGGLVLPGRIDFARLVPAALNAIKWALIFAVITFVPFYFGWRAYWRPELRFSLDLRLSEAANIVLGQLAVIALPEEAFYRGYVQTRIGDAFPRKVRILGAEIGPELLIASLVFALGHVATIRNPGRLAVFFPALLFGWLRSKTRGVGASVLFHALCNVLSETLGRGYGLY